MPATPATGKVLAARAIIAAMDIASRMAMYAAVTALTALRKVALAVQVVPILARINRLLCANNSRRSPVISVIFVISVIGAG